MADLRPFIPDILSQALELPEADRPTFLTDACQGDERVRLRVQQLLAAHPQSSDWLESPAITATVAADDTLGDLIGTHIGPYKLLEQIGEGGMGVVYVAEQVQPVRRRVALKIIKPGMDSKQIIARFEAERQALAMMDHPNIARILDAGTTGAGSICRMEPGFSSDLETQSPARQAGPTGRPFFVMELVRGIPITDFCEQQQLSVPERLQLMLDVCHAVQHAHQKGIIHRDLKPSNILVTLQDGKSVVKVIDFGVAKAIGQQLTDHSIYTAHLQLIGTPLYMSPEQAALSNIDVDTRSDVYSLGVLLYELLTGTTPFTKERLKSAGFDEMRRIIREEEPETVSVRLARTRKIGTRAGNPAGVPAGLGVEGRPSESLPLVPNPEPRPPRLSELDWITSRSLEKDRSRRYESPSALAADIQRYLSGDLVEACPPSTLYRFRKFARKNRGTLLAASSIAVALLVGALVSSWQAIRASQASSLAMSNEIQAREAASAEQVARQAEAMERKRAELGEQKAQKNFEAALEAVDRFLTHLGAEELYEAPHIQPVRKRILEDALQLYKQISPDEVNSPQVRYGVAHTWHHLGYLLEEIGQVELSPDCYERGINIAESLVTDHPDNAEYLCLLADSYTAARLGVATRERCQRAADIYDKLIQQDALTTHEFPILVGSLKNRYVFALHRAGKTDLALEAAEEFGPTADRGRLTLLRIKAHKLRSASSDEPERLYREALSLSREWRARDKASEGRDEQSRYASLLSEVANHFRTQHPDEAETLYRESLEIRRRLALQFPHNPSYQITVADILFELGNLLRQRSAETLNGSDKSLANPRLDEAESLYLEAIKITSTFPKIVRSDNFKENIYRTATSSLFAYRRDLIAGFQGKAGDELLLYLRRVDAIADGWLELCRQRAARFPTKPDARNLLLFALTGQAKYSFGVATMLAKQSPGDAAQRKRQARDFVAEATQLCEALIAEFPENGSYSSSLQGLSQLESQYFRH